MTDRPTRRDIRNRLNDLSGGGGDDWPERVELRGVPATPLNDDGLPVVDEDDEDAPHGRGEDADPITVPIPPTDGGDEETAENGARDDAPECETCGLNPAYPGLSGECEACAGMPRRDWREDVRDPDEEGGDRE